jgi:hypothetical protein
MHSEPPRRSLPSAAADAARTVWLSSSSPLQSGGTARSLCDTPSARAAWVRTRKSLSVLSLVASSVSRSAATAVPVSSVSTTTSQRCQSLGARHLVCLGTIIGRCTGTSIRVERGLAAAMSTASHGRTDCCRRGLARADFTHLDPDRPPPRAPRAVSMHGRCRRAPGALRFAESAGRSDARAPRARHDPGSAALREPPHDTRPERRDRFQRGAGRGHGYAHRGCRRGRSGHAQRARSELQPLCVSQHRSNHPARGRSPNG